MRSALSDTQMRKGVTSSTGSTLRTPCNCKECEDQHRAHYKHKKKYHHVYMNLHGDMNEL